MHCAGENGIKRLVFLVTLPIASLMCVTNSMTHKITTKVIFIACHLQWAKTNFHFSTHRDTTFDNFVFLVRWLKAMG